MKKYWLLGLPFLVVVILDIVTKEYIITHIPLFASQPVIPGFFNLVHIRNKGVAFGILGGAAPFWRDILLLVFPLVAMAGILIFALGHTQKQTGIFLPLGGILGGALGNLIDRFRFHGVIDFLDIYWGPYHWPAFNIADSAITLGILSLALGYLFMKED